MTDAVEGVRDGLFRRAAGGNVKGERLNWTIAFG